VAANELSNVSNVTPDLDLSYGDPLKQTKMAVFAQNHPLNGNVSEIVY